MNFNRISDNVKLGLSAVIVGAASLWWIQDAEYFTGLIHASAHGLFTVSLAILVWLGFDRLAMTDINLKMVTDRKLPGVTRGGIALSYAIFFYGIAYLFASS